MQLKNKTINSYTIVWGGSLLFILNKTAHRDTTKEICVAIYVLSVPRSDDISNSEKNRDF